MRVEIDLDMQSFFNQGKGILNEHWSQVANNQDSILLEPDEEKYIFLQKANALLNVVLFDECGEMIGYSIVFLQPHMHYKNDVFAFVDAIYVREKHRNSRAGLVLINEVERLCIEKRVSLLSYHTKPAHNTLEKILLKKGYNHVENIFGKTLKGKVWGSPQ